MKNTRQRDICHSFTWPAWAANRDRGKRLFYAGSSAERGPCIMQNSRRHFWMVVGRWKVEIFLAAALRQPPLSLPLASSNLTPRACARLSLLVQACACARPSSSSSSNCVRVDIDIDKKKKEKKEAEHVPVHVYVYYVCVCREKRIFGRGEPRFGACGYAARLVEKSLGRTRISGREITGRMSGNAASLFAGKCVKSPSTEPFFRRFFPHEKATIFRPIPLPPPPSRSQRTVPPRLNGVP